MNNNGLNEECGVCGVIGNLDAARLIYLSLYALQHRGQEACGIMTLENLSEEVLCHEHKRFGLVADSFKQKSLDFLKGDLGIGHVRYSTRGGRRATNIQPFSFRLPGYGQAALAHNGNLTNAEILRQSLEEKGSIFTSSTDSELFLHLLARSSSQKLEEKLKDTFRQVEGAYALVMMLKNTLIGVRDPFGFRPLVIGKKDKTWVFASESCALDLIGAQLVREVEAGEIVIASTHSPTLCSIKMQKRTEKPCQKAFCSFEPIYFSRPDSVFNKQSIYEVRKNLGRQLAKEKPCEADLVIPVPDSGVPMALGFSEASGLRFELGLVRNHYVGRTFIEPTQAIRDFGVKLKLNPIRSVLEGKRVVVVDDSLVRGTTCQKIIRMIRNAGASKVHLRIASPAIKHPCHYGVNTPDYDELIAAKQSLEEIQDNLQADSLYYLSQAGLSLCLRNMQESFCFACFDGKYKEKVYQQKKQRPYPDSLY